jgi:hypothetical protein
MRLNQNPADAPMSEPRRIEKLERLEGMTDKIFAGVVVLVVAVSAIAMLVSNAG